jgi:Polysaccharide lyase family 4, domain II
VRINLIVACIVMALLLTAVTLPILNKRSADGYDAVTVGDGGSIKGKVVFNGTVPSKRKVVPTKDREVCGSGVREVDQIMVGPDKSVQEAVVYLAKVEKGKAWPKLAKAPEVENLKCDFVPHVQVLPVGDFVVVNSDPVLHNTKSFFDKTPVFNLALPNQGQRITRQIKRTGVMRIECDAHGWMLGWAYVADNPYYAITPKDGTFTLTDVPPGSYTLVAWQEFTGPVETQVTVKPKEATTVTVELKK